MLSYRTIYVLAFAFLLSACDSNSISICGDNIVQQPEREKFILKMAHDNTCKEFTGEAFFDQGSNVRNRQRERVVLLRLDARSGSETPLTLWFTREQDAGFNEGKFQVAQLPNEPEGPFDTRFVTNDTTFSFMAQHILERNRMAFSIDGSIVISHVNQEVVIGSFKIKADLDDSNESVLFIGKFSALYKDIGYPIIL